MAVFVQVQPVFGARERVHVHNLARGRRPRLTFTCRPYLNKYTMCRDVLASRELLGVAHATGGTPIAPTHKRWKCSAVCLIDMILA